MWSTIKEFFQSMYDSVFSTIIDWHDSFMLFITNSYDIILILIIFALAIVAFMLLKYITVPAIILGQIVMLTVSITMVISFVSLLATAFVSIYNRIFTLADYIADGGTSGCFMDTFSCLGANGIISFYFTELFAILILVLLIRLSSLFFWALDYISERIYRIGVLIGSL